MPIFEYESMKQNNHKEEEWQNNRRTSGALRQVIR